MIDWGVLEDNSLNSVQLMGSTDIKFRSDFRPKLSYVPSHYQKDHQLVTFHGFESTKFMHFRFEPKMKAIEWSPDFDSHINSMIDPKAVIDINDNLYSSVVSIIAQYSPEDYSRNRNQYFESVEGHGLIVWFIIDKKLKYCYTNIHELSELVID